MRLTAQSSVPHPSNVAVLGLCFSFCHSRRESAFLLSSRAKGNSGKDAVVGPGRVNFSTSLYKTFPLGRSDNAPRFEFRAESFNTFNYTQFQHVDTGYADNCGG